MMIERISLEDVKKLVENTKHEERNRGIMLQDACQHGQLDVVTYLLEQGGVDIHFNNDYPLRCACFYGYLEVVKYLIKNGAGMNNNFGGVTSMHIEITNYLKLVKKMRELEI